MASPLAATDAEVNEIIRILVKARERPGSDDFLDGFPWTKHIQWYRIEKLTTYDLENVYLFWDGTAWGEGSTLPRRLKQGTETFRAMVGNIYQPNFEHMTDILKARDRYRAGYEEQETFLILIAQNFNGPFLILDGNHRAVAGLWWHYESGKTTHLPKTAWIGISDWMKDYRYYNFVLQAEEEKETRQ